jgi:hypothetical protein
MQHLFVEYPLALKLKEAGFTGACLGFYDGDGCFHPNIQDFYTCVSAGWISEEAAANYDGDDHLFVDFDPNTIDGVPDVSAPIFQQVFDWLEGKGIIVHQWYNPQTELHYAATLWGTDGKELWSEYEYPDSAKGLHSTRKQAWDIAIEEALKLLKEKQAK